MVLLMGMIGGSNSLSISRNSVDICKVNTCRLVPKQHGFLKVIFVSQTKFGEPRYGITCYM